MIFLLSILSPFSALWSWFTKISWAAKMCLILTILVVLLANLYRSTERNCQEAEQRLVQVESSYSEKVHALEVQNAAINNLIEAQKKQQKHYEDSLKKAKIEASKHLAKAEALSKIKPTGNDCADVAKLFTIDKSQKND